MFKWLDVEANSHHSEGSIVLHEEEMIAVPSESCCCVMISQITLIPIICSCNWNVWSSFKNKLKRSCRKCLLYEIVNSKFFFKVWEGQVGFDSYFLKYFDDSPRRLHYYTTLEVFLLGPL